MYIFYMVLVSFIETTRQIFIKKIMKTDGNFSMNMMYNLIKSRMFLVVIFLSFMSIILYILALNRASFSKVYPLFSLNYVFALLGSYFILREKISVNKIIGCVFIVIGVIFVSQ